MSIYEKREDGAGLARDWETVPLTETGLENVSTHSLAPVTWSLVSHSTPFHTLSQNLHAHKFLAHVPYHCNFTVFESMTQISATLELWRSDLGVSVMFLKTC